MDFASTKSTLSVSANWIVAPYVGWFHRCGSSWDFVVALLCNLRRSAWTYPRMEKLKFLLTESPLSVRTRYLYPVQSSVIA